MAHLGIRLRISVPSGVLYDCDSDITHIQAKYGAGFIERCTPCTPACLPGCDEHGWLDLTEGLLGWRNLKVEVKPVSLPDYSLVTCLCANCSGCTGCTEPDDLTHPFED